MKTSFTLSVLHTGTTFVEALLNKTSRGFHHVHNRLDPITLAKMRASDIIVIPLRHPQKVWESYVKRGRTEDEYQFAWYRLTQLSLAFRVLYLPVDLPGYRSLQLALLEEFLQTRFPTNWEPLGAFTGEAPETYPVLDLLPNLPFYT